jgi:antitoxin Phd
MSVPLAKASIIDIKAIIALLFYEVRIMFTFGAREAKNEFGRLLDTAQRETVTIKKKGRPVAVVMSIDEFKRLEEAEDALWAILAKASEVEGLVSPEESEKFLESLRHAKT